MKESDLDAQRHLLTGQLGRLKELSITGDIDRPAYGSRRERIERDHAALQPVERRDDYLQRLTEHVESLPAAWGDADQSQRNELAKLMDEDVWVDGPVVEYVQPRSEVEALFQMRTGAAQPTSSNVPPLLGRGGSGDPDGGRDRICQHDGLVIQLRPQPRGRSRRMTSAAMVALTLSRWPEVAHRVRSGESSRALARAYSVSHESIRRTDKSELRLAS